MSADEIDRKSQILKELKRRRDVRELQKAKLGVSADPIIYTEIEDLTQQIVQVEKELETLTRTFAHQEYDDAERRLRVNQIERNQSINIEQDRDVAKITSEITLSSVINSREQIAESVVADGTKSKIEIDKGPIENTKDQLNSISTEPTLQDNDNASSSFRYSEQQYLKELKDKYTQPFQRWRKREEISGFNIPIHIKLKIGSINDKIKELDTQIERSKELEKDTGHNNDTLLNTIEFVFPMKEEVSNLEKELEEHRRNLQSSDEQAATYGKQGIPRYLWNRINEEENEIASILFKQMPRKVTTEISGKERQTLTTDSGRDDISKTPVLPQKNLLSVPLRIARRIAVYTIVTLGFVILLIIFYLIGPSRILDLLKDITIVASFLCKYIPEFCYNNST